MGRHWLKKFLRSEEAQATTEYMVLLAVIVSMLVVLVKQLIQPAFEKLAENLSNSLQKRLFGADLHRFRVP